MDTGLMGKDIGSETIRLEFLCEMVHVAAASTMQGP
jgi:hypothetical protein